jgi:uncharacterized metal-binding protein YceD (DUF177 family)
MMTDHSPASPSQPASRPPAALSLPFRVAALSPRKPTRFDLVASAEQLAALARELDLSRVEHLGFKGEIRPKGKHDYVIVAELRAQIVQPCSITLRPVKTRIAESVQRVYLAGYVLPEGDEIEMPEDDSIEALPEVIDPGFVATEALALAIPLYPRSEGAELGDVTVTAPGLAPLKEADLKPFAGLAGLKARLEGQKGGNDDQS